MKRFSLFASLALFVSSFAATDASALFLGNSVKDKFKTRAQFLNCTGAKVRICLYNNYDVSEKVPSGGSGSSIKACGQKSQCSGDTAALDYCDTDGSCRVRLIAGGGSCFTKDPDLSSTVRENAYRIVKDGKRLKLERASKELRYFDKSENRGCP